MEAGKYILSVGTAVDGSQVPDCIAVQHFTIYEYGIDTPNRGRDVKRHQSQAIIEATMGAGVFVIASERQLDVQRRHELASNALSRLPLIRAMNEHCAPLHVIFDALVRSQNQRERACHQ